MTIFNPASDRAVVSRTSSMLGNERAWWFDIIMKVLATANVYNVVFQDTTPADTKVLWLTKNVTDSAPAVARVYDPVSASWVVLTPERFAEWAAAPRIVANTNIVVNPLGGADFLTLKDAWAYLKKFRIDSAVTVSIIMETGSHTIASPLVLDHPDGAQITLKGRPASAILHADLPANAVNNAGNRTSQKAIFDARFPSKIALGPGATLTARQPITLQDWYMDAALQTYGLVVDGCTVTIAGQFATIRGATAGVHCTRGGELNGSGAYWTSDCDIGLRVYGGGSAALSGLFGTFSGALHGVIVGPGSSVTLSGSTLASSGNGGMGFYSAGGDIVLGLGTTVAISSRYNGQGGIYADMGRITSTAVITASNNTGSGIAAIRGGVVDAFEPVCQNNSLYGLRATNCGQVLLAGSVATVDASNTSGGVQAADGGRVHLLGATVTGSLSPSVDTLGNRGAFIGS